MTDNKKVTQILQERGITAVVTEAGLAIHAVGIAGLHPVRAWLFETGYVDAGTFRQVSAGAYVVTYIHPKKAGLDLVYLTTKPEDFLRSATRHGVPVISWPNGS